MFNDDERRFADAVCGLAFANPFPPGRMELEWQALGHRPARAPRIWNRRAGMPDLRPEVLEIVARCGPLLERCREAVLADPRRPQADLLRYEGLAVFWLFHQVQPDLSALVRAPAHGPAQKFEGWPAFHQACKHLLQIPGLSLPDSPSSAHLLAMFFQIQRAVEHIFDAIIGASLAAAELRAAVWQSIFTCDARRYFRALYGRLGDFSTLVVGASGTGKELVARAIGLSRYLPFDVPSQSFAADFRAACFPLNLSALSPTLIESELFGHKRGAFTGAVADRQGWLEMCGERGTVFLDEIGDVPAAIQVKLLRVLQTRQFERLGASKPRRFEGKIIAATHRDLAAEMAAGSFRQDLYYRLCGDIIRTPCLAEQLADNPDELPHLVRFIADRLVGDEAEPLTGQVVAWVRSELDGYAWPGNFRELEQCVRNILIRGAYRPAHNAAAWEEQMRAGSLSADELLHHYCRHVYAQAGSFQEAARRLKLDRRTVKSRVEREA